MPRQRWSGVGKLKGRLEQCCQTRTIFRVVQWRGDEDSGEATSAISIVLSVRVNELAVSDSFMPEWFDPSATSEGTDRIKAVH